MARDYQINGPTLVTVKGGAHMSGSPIALVTQLGLAVDDITITPTFIQKDMNVDDFGSQVPAEIMTLLAYVDIRMVLIHWDLNAFNMCMAETLGGVPPGLNLNARNPFRLSGFLLPPAGSLLGNNLPVFSSGCHYVSLNVINPAMPTIGLNWRFPASRLLNPLNWPLGSKPTHLVTNWRAIPYTPYRISGTLMPAAEISSSGRLLWDYLTDTDPPPGQPEAVPDDNPFNPGGGNVQVGN